MVRSARSNKLRGMFMGLAVGDALGALYEFQSAEEINKLKILEMRQIHDTTGVWTDDTAMALCLADSLIKQEGYDSYDVMERYWKWANEGYRTYYSFGEGIGGQTASAIQYFSENDPIVPKTKPRDTAAGNGAIMRLAPIIIAAYGRNPIHQVIRLAQVSARETHYSYEAEAGAEIFAAMLHSAVGSDDKSSIISVHEYSTGKIYDDILSRILTSYSVRSKLLNLGGYVVDALRIAVWGFMNFDSFADGVENVIRLGGDTDTNAAVYGQLAGTYYGYDQIPSRWHKAVYLEGEILEISSRLALISSAPVLATRFEEDNFV